VLCQLLLLGLIAGRRCCRRPLRRSPVAGAPLTSNCFAAVPGPALQFVVRLAPLMAIAVLDREPREVVVPHCCVPTKPHVAAALRLQMHARLVSEGNDKPAAVAWPMLRAAMLPKSSQHPGSVRESRRPVLFCGNGRDCPLGFVAPSPNGIGVGGGRAGSRPERIVGCERQVR